MYTLVIPESEIFDEATNTFIPIKQQTLVLEHSLVSLRKWESRWHKPFLGKEPQTIDETIDYIRCMTITQNVNPYAYCSITRNMINEINAYIQDPMTATTFSENSEKPNNDIITAEILYYDMFALGIPLQCEKWHLNQLITLIRVCNIKNNPKKMSRKELANKHRAINKARRKKKR